MAEGSLGQWDREGAVGPCLDCANQRRGETEGIWCVNKGLVGSRPRGVWGKGVIEEGLQEAREKPRC